MAKVSVIIPSRNEQLELIGPAEIARQKDCERARRYRLKYPDRVREQQERHRKSQRRKETLAAWKAANKEYLRQDSRQRYHSDPEKAREKARRFYAATRERILARIREKKYGLTADEVSRLIEDQGGLCGGCSDPLTTVVAIDHNHSTGAVRGALCRNCNLALGLLADSPERLRALAVYVERADRAANVLRRVK